MNDQLRIHETNFVSEDGQPIHLAYEEIGDILEVVFQGVKGNCAVELTNDILLNFQREQEQAAGLTIMNFSILSTATELGPRSFALTGLDTLPDDLRETVVRLIMRPPVNQFLNGALRPTM
jgi:hypothetical protein